MTSDPASDRALHGSACTACGHLMYPPRLWCSCCQSDVSPKEIGTGSVVDIVSVLQSPGSTDTAPLSLALVDAGAGAKMIAAVRGAVAIGSEAHIGATADATPWVAANR